MPATTAPSSASLLAAAGRWPRERWVAAADDLLRATTPFASPGGSLIRLPGPVSASGPWSDGLEGYARTFLLAAFRLRGADGDDPDGLLDRYARGLRHGTDPASPERWPRLTERRQAVVEAASVAIGLAETRPWLWDRLDDATRARTVDWLADIVGTDGYTNNWLWFQNVVEAFLSTVGGPWDQADLDRNDEIAESLYVGDGWYSDGRGRDGRRQNFDHYAGWAWHVYPVLHARILGADLDDRHAGRLRAYLDQAQHLVSSRGAPLLQGRSVTYRTAVLGPFWAGAVAGATPLAPGQTRALASAVADHFWAAGAVDERGLLPVGWHGPYPRVRQLYTGGSSPYWASKGFLGLLLGADHPVWTAAPQPPDAWHRDRVTVLPAPGWVVAATPGDGVVRVLNHGSDRAIEPPLEPRGDDPFYRRLGYSGATSPQLSARDVAAPLDSHTALLDATGLPSHRVRVDRVALRPSSGPGDRVGGAVAVSRSPVHWLDLPGGGDAGDAAGWAALRRGPTLTTAAVVRGRWEVRLARWTPSPGGDAGLAPRPGDDLDRDAAWPADPGPWTAHVGGWPLAAAGDGALHTERDNGWVRVRRADGTTSLVRSLHGDGTVPLDEAGATRRHGADPLGEASATPWLRSTRNVGTGDVVAALVVLDGLDGHDAGGVPGRGPDGGALPRVRVLDGTGGSRVEVRWPDGSADLVDLGADTDDTDDTDDATGAAPGATP